MKTSAHLFRIFFLLAFIGLAACDDNETVVPAKNGLVARAGEDQSTQVGTEIQLDGSETDDKNGKPFTFHWTLKIKPANSIATLATPDQNKTTITPDAAGNYVIELTIKQGTWSATDYVTVTATSNEPTDPVPVIIDADINT